MSASNRATAIGCLMVIIMGQLYVWWLVIAYADFKFILGTAIIIVHLVHLFLYMRGRWRAVWKTELRDHAITILTLVTAIAFDHPLRQFGGIENYFMGAAGQQIIFFFCMPRWLKDAMEEKTAYALSGWIYCAFHLPNIPLTGITLLAGIIFAHCHSRWRVMIFPAAAFLHYVGGSVLHRYIDMKVGALLLK